MKKVARKEYNVTPEQFVMAWEASASAQECADKLKMPKPIVLARASSYRKDGINLKKMKRGVNGLNIGQLNDLIDTIRDVDARSAKNNR